MMRLSLAFFLLFVCNLLAAQDLYSLTKISEVRLTFADPDWDHKLDSMKQSGSEGRLFAIVTIDGARFDSVGVRYKGNSSYFNVRNSGSAKLPFNVKADEVRKNQTFPGGYRTLKLSNAFRDPSFIREPLSYEIARNYMHSPRANFIKLYVNNKYLGIYNNTESIDDLFLKKEFGSSRGILFKCDPNWDAKEIKGCPPGEKASLMYLGEDSTCYHPFYEKESKRGWSELINLIRILNKEPDKIESVLNVDQALWMLAFDNVLVNLDSYVGRLSHNYYLYLDSTGRFTPLLWDMNLSFGAFNLDGITPGNLGTEKLQNLSPFLHYENPKRPLISQLLKKGIYRKTYVAHIRTILNEFVKNKRYSTRANELRKQIEPLIKNDPAKLYSFEAFQNNFDSTVELGKTRIIGINELMTKRLDYLLNHPLLKKEPPALSDVKQLLSPATATILAKAGNAQQLLLYYRENQYLVFKSTPMFDDGQHNDGAAGDGVYGAEIPRQNDIQYYVYAENEENATLLPERAAFEFYTLKL